MRKNIVVAALAAVSSFASTQVHAVACTALAPFADVLASDTNCSSVEWIKNRAITLGCGGALYCPSDYVTRIQMALFMNRMADAIHQQPVSTNLDSGALALSLLATGSVPCTAIVALVGYPRTLVVSAHGSFKMTAASGDIGLHILYTLDGNTTNWNVATANSQRTTATTTAYGHVSHTAVIQVPAGAPVKLGTGVFSAGGSTAVAQSSCQITGQIQTRTGTSTPFDEPLLLPPPGDGF